MNGGLFPAYKPTGVWWRDHSLSIVLTILMVGQTIFALTSGAYVFNREDPFGPDVNAFGSEFWWWWSWEYNVSLVADTFGVLLVVLLTKWLRERGSAESS